MLDPRALLAALPVVLIASTAAGQCPTTPGQSPLQPGEIGLFYDPGGTKSCGRPTFASPTLVYAVARIPEGGISRIELGSLDTEGNVLPSVEATIVAPGFVHHVFADWCDLGAAEDPDVCTTTPGDVVALGTYQILWMGGDATVCLTDRCDDTFAGPGQQGNLEPRYTSCGASPETTPFLLGELACLQIRENAVAIPQPSWSALKARW